MSETPRTDKACGWPWGHHGRIESSDLKLSPDGPFVHSSVARELERENAALRELLHRSLFWLDDYDSRQFSGSAKIADDIKEVLQKEAQP